MYLKLLIRISLRFTLSCLAIVLIKAEAAPLALAARYGSKSCSVFCINKEHRKIEIGVFAHTDAASTRKWSGGKRMDLRLKSDSSQESQIHWLFQTRHRGRLLGAVQLLASASHCCFLVCCSEEFAGLCAVTPRVTKGAYESKSQCNHRSLMAYR